jgi:hypothetical protein
VSQLASRRGGKLARPLAEIRDPRPVMQRSTDRIYTTHVGSLARPRALLDLMKAAAEGRQVDVPATGSIRDLAFTTRHWPT